MDFKKRGSTILYKNITQSVLNSIEGFIFIQLICSTTEDVLTCKCVILRSMFMAEVSQFSETYL